MKMIEADACQVLSSGVKGDATRASVAALVNRAKTYRVVHEIMDRISS